ncbi:MAG: mannose-1-phosphate guanylyltransferase [Runella sp.]
MNNHNYVVIMAGGVGSRFWPFSRNHHPKQFHDVLGTGKTLLQQTAERFDGVCPNENIYVVTSVDYYDLVKSQLPFLSDEQILLEPHRRNTAPCIGYACYKIATQDPAARVVVAPADHIILKEDVFRQKIKTALQVLDSQDVLLTLGIQPTRPDTGYGYIQFVPSDESAQKVKKFTEKPPLPKAIQFLESGDYVWNAGIFIWSVKSLKEAFRQQLPELDKIFEKGKEVYYTDREQNFINQVYADCQSISIDYGIMEKAENVYVVMGDFGWSDLGTWKSLYDISPKNEQYNVTTNQVLFYDSSRCVVKTEADKLVVVQGLEGYIIAENEGVLMICQIDQEQRVRDFVADAQKINTKYS